MAELKNLQASGLTTLGPALKNAFDLLNINRMQTGIDTYGQGRCPFYLEPSVLVVITDGHRLTSSAGAHDEVNCSCFTGQHTRGISQCSARALFVPDGLISYH
ncbi:hypothetical protein HPB48_007707 [Haemaphysalis longicornis]|uniref:Uncharacterized protein n=1 Tax=Haemaphysalis longicornis TaxID=44386 RepID=A0A9J6G5N3_HAELO|nr:hypothetical protein HPB48_007707 [Haemaphysalis longicornis]